jgi:hypothetical protein
MTAVIRGIGTSSSAGRGAKTTRTIVDLAGMAEFELRVYSETDFSAKPHKWRFYKPTFTIN